MLEDTGGESKVIPETIENNSDESRFSVSDENEKGNEEYRAPEL
jgi:hypothetical protein